MSGSVDPGRLRAWIQESTARGCRAPQHGHDEGPERAAQHSSLVRSGGIRGRRAEEIDHSRKTRVHHTGPLHLPRQKDLAIFLWPRARIVIDHAEAFEDNIALSSMPATQFVFRAKETVEGAAQRNIKSFGALTTSIFMPGTATSSGTMRKHG